MAVLSFVFFTAFEKKGVVKYGQYKPTEKGVKNIKVLFRRNIVKFTFISFLTGVVRTSVVFWLPTYINQYLGFAADTSATVFTVATLVISFTAFIAVFTYERLGHDINKTVLLMFSCAVIFFTLTYFVKHPISIGKRGNL